MRWTDQMTGELKAEFFGIFFIQGQNNFPDVSCSWIGTEFLVSRSDRCRAEGDLIVICRNLVSDQ